MRQRQYHTLFTFSTVFINLFRIEELVMIFTNANDFSGMPGEQAYSSLSSKKTEMKEAGEGEENGATF